MNWPRITLTDESHEMWKIDELGLACWVFGESICSFDLRGGDSNLSFRPRQTSGATASDQTDHLGLSIASIDGQSLPPAAEQFICENGPAQLKTTFCCARTLESSVKQS